MTPQPHKHFISGLWTPGPPCRSSGPSPLTCHISLESAGLGPVVVGRGPLRQQVDGLAKPLQGCAEVASLRGHHPLQLQGLGLLHLCSRENSICVGEGARRGHVRSWEQEAKAPLALESWGLSGSGLGWDVGHSRSRMQCRGQRELRSPRLRASTKFQRDLGKGLWSAHCQENEAQTQLIAKCLTQGHTAPKCTAWI